MNDDITTIHRKKNDSINWAALLSKVASVAGTVGLAIAGWAHGVLWSHDTRLTTLEVQRAAHAADYQQHQERDAKMQDQVRETLRRMEDKLDAIRERIAKP